MRLFVAAELDETVRSAAEQVARELDRRLDPRIRVRWVPSENMHLTVRFVGHVDESRLAAVLDALSPALPIAAFSLTLGPGGVFPASGPPRAIWIGLAEGLSSLTQVHRALDGRLAGLGFEPENRPFSAHLTLARVKDIPRDASRSAREVIGGIRVPPACCTVRAVTVFQSLLSSRGSTYQRLLEIPCAEPPL